MDSVVKSTIVSIISVIIGLIVVFFTKDIKISRYRGGEMEQTIAYAIVVAITILPFAFAVLSIAKSVIDNLRYIELYTDHVEGKKLAKNNYGYNDIYLNFDQISGVSVESGVYICINASGVIYKARSSKAKEFMSAYNSYVNFKR